MMGGVGLGVTGLYYRRWLEVGLGYTAQTMIFTYTSQVPGLLAGVAGTKPRCRIWAGKRACRSFPATHTDS
jgi:hypothetical protein